MADLLTLTEPQTIQQAEETAQLLRDRLAANTDLVLDCSAIEETDLSFVQLMAAAHRSFQSRGLSLRLARRADGPLLAALDRVGIKPGGSQNFWFEGSEAQP